MSSPRRRRAQALVEFALTLPIFTLFILTVMQLGLVAIMYFSEAYMTLTTVRWLAIHNSVTDDQVATHLQDNLLAGMVGGTPFLVTAGTSSIDTVYTVGQMTITFTPCVPNGVTCTHPDRAPGEALFVRCQYDMFNLFFVPTDFRMSNYAVYVPTTLPPYQAYALVE